MSPRSAAGSGAPAEFLDAAAAPSELGAGLGIAVFGTIGTAIYSDQIADAMPNGVPATTAETARDSFAGAFAAARELPTGTGGELLTISRDAFMSGMNVVTAISALVMIGVAALVITTLRHVPAIGGDTNSPEAPEANDPGVCEDTVANPK